jgi:hypothetical protein
MRHLVLVVHDLALLPLENWPENSALIGPSGFQTGNSAGLFPSQKRNDSGE